MSINVSNIVRTPMLVHQAREILRSMKEIDANRLLDFIERKAQSTLTREDCERFLPEIIAVFPPFVVSELHKHKQDLDVELVETLKSGGNLDDVASKIEYGADIHVLGEYMQARDGNLPVIPAGRPKLHLALQQCRPEREAEK